MKKALKIFGIILGVFIILLLASPFLFKGSLEKILKQTINENLNATVAWEDLDLSLFSSFPDASLKLGNFSVINKAPFEGDTLASGQMLKLDMGIMQLFKSKDLKIDAVKLERALINIKVDSLGNANYDIAIKTDAPAAPESPVAEESFTFELNTYEIADSRINYFDESSKTYLMLTKLQHSGSGDLSQEITKLDTETEAFVSFKMDNTEYLSKNRISLDAILQLDLKNQKYTFLENEAKINELPLTFDGFVQLHETNTEVDITFNTPSSDFKNFLAVIPETYLKQISDVKTTGNFSINGMVKGIVDSVYIPVLDIRVESNNASFKYPDLPKTVDNITIDAQLKNETGLLKDTYLNIPKLTFRIDGQPFRMNGNIKQMTENPLVDLEMQGTLNLANIKQVLPVEMEQDLSGIFKADIKANFDMESVEKEQYEKMDIRGTASITDFNYDAGFKNDFEVMNANLSLSPGRFALEELNAKTGQTDFRASGNIQNLIPFLMAQQDLKGRFAIESNTFNVNDFMAETADSSAKSSQTQKTQETQPSEAVKIPDFLDATLDFNANKIIYGDLELLNAKGTAAIKDEALALNDFTSDIFGGNIALSGNVSTKTETPTFSMNLDLSEIDITQSFNQLEMFQYLVPIAKALQGSLNTNFKLNGELTNDLSPQLSTLAGSVLAQVLTAEVDPEKTPLLSALGDKVSFLDLDRLSLRNVTTNLTFDNGKIQVKPFHFDVEGVDVAVAGTHGLDKSINYNLTLDVPAKYLGTEVTTLLQQLDPKEADEMSVKLPVGLSGSFSSPIVSLNTEKAVTELTQEILAKQKGKMIDKGKDYLGDLLGGKKKSDSTQTNPQKNQEQNTQEKTKEKAKDLIKGLFNRD